MMPPIGTENTIPASIDETPSTASSGVVSRFLLSDDKREDKNRWEKKKREEDTSWFKEKRKEEKEVGGYHDLVHYHSNHWLLGDAICPEVKVFQGVYDNSRCVYDCLFELSDSMI